MDVTQHPHRGNSVFVEGRDAFQIDVCLWNSTRFQFFLSSLGYSWQRCAALSVRVEFCQ